MKLMRSRYDKLIMLVLSLSSIFIINHVNKWHEPFMYTMAVALTVYSYLIAIGVVASVTVYSIWSIIHNVKVATKLRMENIQIMKSLTQTMNEISQGKPSNTIIVKY